MTLGTNDSITDIHQNNALPYAGSRILFIVMLSVDMVIVVMLASLCLMLLRRVLWRQIINEVVYNSFANRALKSPLIGIKQKWTACASNKLNASSWVSSITCNYLFGYDVVGSGNQPIPISHYKLKDRQNIVTK
jgi:hypothetical protein